jgi:predicted dehydrogenase
MTPLRPAGPPPHEGPATPRVALIGANGHGRWHRRTIAELQDAGALRLVAVAEPNPLDPDPPLPPDVAVFTGHRELLAAVRPDVVVIASPPHTHLPITLDALAAGSDVLLEKPPVRTLAEHQELTEAVDRTGRICQVGFQALGSTASATLFRAIAERKLGTVTAVATVASWRRDDSYYARAPWAGRRTVDGRPVVDGALANPLAHALMQCLAAAEAAGAGQALSMQLERYRTRDIEADDTTFARITFDGGLRLMAAVTLAGEDFIAGEVIVRGTAGRAILEYPTDKLALRGDSVPMVVPGRTNLLANLLAHRAGPAIPLLVPLSRTESFTAVLQALTSPQLAAPTRLGPPHAETHGGERVIPGINAILHQAATSLALPSESDVPWAQKPTLVRIPSLRRTVHTDH